MICDNLIGLFNMLAEEGIEYCALKRHDFCSSDSGADIDLLVHHGSRDLFLNLLKKNGWNKVKHPHDYSNQFVFLYSMPPLEFFQGPGRPIDVTYKLACRSLNAGEWIPLDDQIQQFIWSNRVAVSGPWKFELPPEAMFIHLVTKAVFDKSRFPEIYKLEVIRCLSFSDITLLKTLLEKVFFKFTPQLLQMVKAEEFDRIRKNYIQFREY